MYLPEWAEPVEWLVGADWPRGDEDAMWDMAEELKAIGGDIKTMIPDLDGIIDGLSKAYPEGSGGEKILEWIKPLRDGTGKAGDKNGTLEEFADNMIALGDSADGMGDQLEAAKLNFIIAAGWLIAELAMAWFAGPFAPAAHATAIAVGRITFATLRRILMQAVMRVISRLLVRNLREITAKQVGKIVMKMAYAALKEAAQETAQGTIQEGLVQAIQNANGHVDGFDMEALKQNALISAIAGGAGGLAGNIGGKVLPMGAGRWKGAAAGALNGGFAGLAGAGAAYYANGLIYNQWDFDPRSLTGGALSGAGPGAIHGFRGTNEHGGTPGRLMSPLLPDGTRPPGLGPQDPGSGPQDPGNGPQDPGNGPQDPGNGPQAPGDGPQAPGDGPQAPGNGPQAPGDGPQAPGDGPQAPGANDPAANNPQQQQQPGEPGAGQQNTRAGDPTATQDGQQPAGTDPTASTDPGSTSDNTGNNPSNPGNNAPGTSPAGSTGTIDAPADTGQSNTSTSSSSSSNDTNTNNPGPAGSTNSNNSGTGNTDSASAGPANTGSSTTSSTPEAGATSSANDAPAQTNSPNSPASVGDPQSSTTNPNGSPATSAPAGSTPLAASPDGTNPAVSQPGSPAVNPTVAAGPVANAAPVAASTANPASTAPASSSTTSTNPGVSEARPVTGESSRAQTPNAPTTQSTPNTQNPNTPPTQQPAAPRAGATDPNTGNPLGAPVQATSTGLTVPSTDTNTQQDADLQQVPPVLPMSPITDSSSNQQTQQGNRPGVPNRFDSSSRPGSRDLVGADRGTASPVGDFRGDARPAGNPIQDSDLSAQIRDALPVIAPHTVPFDADTRQFTLPNGDVVTIRVGDTENNAVASFQRNATGFDINVSPQARPEDIARALAHEMNEILLSFDPTIQTDPTTERPTQMTSHLGGRFAELNVLLHQLNRAHASPAHAHQLPQLQQDLKDLLRHIGVTDPAHADTVRKLLNKHDPKLAKRLQDYLRNPPSDSNLPTGLARGQDGYLHMQGDRSESYRDHNGDLHHKNDQVGTSRDRGFGYRWESNRGDWATDPNTNQDVKHKAKLGPKQPYTLPDQDAQAQLDQLVARAEAEDATRAAHRATAAAQFGDHNIKNMHDLGPKDLTNVRNKRTDEIDADLAAGRITPTEAGRLLDSLDTMLVAAQKYNDLNPTVVQTSKDLGELGGKTHSVDPGQYPDATRMIPFPGFIDGNDTFDVVSFVPGTNDSPPRLVIDESKGGESGTLGSAKTDHGRSEQGSAPYAQRTADIDENLGRLLTETPQEMAARGVDPNSPEARALLEARAQLLRAFADGTLEIEYHKVHVKRDGSITIAKFNLDFNGSPIEFKTLGGVTPDQARVEAARLEAELAADTDTDMPQAPATPDPTADLPVQHGPDRLAIGTDPATNRVLQNLRNEGNFDVILHGGPDGIPTDGNGNRITPEQVAAAIRSSSDYTPGDAVRLVSCNSANGFAQQLADALGAPVIAPSDVVGIRNRPDSPAILPGHAAWHTHQPTPPGGTTPIPSVHKPDTNVPPKTIDGPDWDRMDSPDNDQPPPPDPQSQIEAALQRELAAMNNAFDRNEAAARADHQRLMDRLDQARQELERPLDLPENTVPQNVSTDPPSRVADAVQRELAAMNDAFDRNETAAREQHQRLMDQLDQAIQSLDRPPVLTEDSVSQDSTDPRSRIDDALQRELAAMNDAFDRNETAAREQHQRLMDQLDQAIQSLDRPPVLAEDTGSQQATPVAESRVDTALQRELAAMNEARDTAEAAAREEHQQLMDQLEKSRQEMAERFAQLEQPGNPDNALPVKSPESEAAVADPNDPQSDPDAAQPDSPNATDTPQQPDTTDTQPDPLQAIRDFLSAPGSVDAANPPTVTDAERAHARDLDAALGLDGLLANHPDPIGALRELAEVAAVRDLFAGPDSADVTRPLQPSDFTDPVDIDQIYGDEQYWRNEANPDQLAEIEAHLAEIGQSPETTPALDPATDPAVPQVAPASTTSQDLVPRLASVTEVREQLTNQFGRTDTDLNPRNLPATVADLRMRNLVRAGVVEALADAAARHQAATDPAARAQIANTRDAWARRLGVDPAALDVDPARVIDEQRAAVLREANDIADLADVVQVADQGEAATLQYVDVNGERVPVRLVPEGDGRWRVESRDRLPAAAVSTDRPALPPADEPKRNRIQRLWDRLRGGYTGQRPAYPIGYKEKVSGHERAMDGITAITGLDLGAVPSAGVVSNYITMWRRRELLPFLKRFMSRMPDASADVPAPRSRDGREYEYWIDEADPELFQREHRISLEDYRAHLAAQRAAETAVDPGTQPPVEGATQPAAIATPQPELGEPLPRTAQEVAEWVQELDQAQADRNDLARQLRQMAIDLDVDLPDNPTPEALRRALHDLEYMQARRLGALLGLSGAAGRYNVDNAWIPFTDQISNLDNDPLGRFLKEVVIAFGGKPGTLDWEPVNNGGEPGPIWRDIDLAAPPGRDEGLWPFLDNALRRDQLLDERSVWAQMLGVDLEALDPQLLRDTLGEQFAGLLAHVDAMNEFRSTAEQFVRADSEVQELRHALAEIAGAEWVLSQGGAMLTGGIGLAPGGPGQPMRLIVLDAAGDHNTVLAQALAEHPDLAAAVNDKTVQVDRRVVRVGSDGMIRVAEGGTPQVLHMSSDLTGRRADITLVREEGGHWQAVPDPLPVTDTAAEQAEQDRRRDAAIDELPTDELVRWRDQLIADLGLAPDTQLTRAQIAELRYENMVRAAQIEAIIDHARIAWDIETYNDLTDARHRVAHFLKVDPAQLTPQRLAEAFADPAVRNGLRAQQVEALVTYTDLVRGIDSDAVDAARDRLARRLGIEPEDLFPYKQTGDDNRLARRLGITPEELASYRYVDEHLQYLPDPEAIDPKKLWAAIANMVNRPGERAELIAALTEFAETLARLDMFDPVQHGTDALDPRVAGKEFPVHERAVDYLRNLIGDVRQLTDLFMQHGLPALPDPNSERPRPSSDFNRIMGVDTTPVGRVDTEADTKANADAIAKAVAEAEAEPGANAESVAAARKLAEAGLAADAQAEISAKNNARWAAVYEVYRDGKLEQDERLSPDQLAELQQRLRGEVADRDANLRALDEVARRLEPPLDGGDASTLPSGPQPDPGAPHTPENGRPETDPAAADQDAVQQADPNTPDLPATPDLPVQHAPDRLAIGTDPATQRVFQNLRNEGAFDVILHGDADGNPTDGNGNRVDIDQLAEAIQNSPGYNQGDPVRLVACNSATIAQQLANALGAPVTAPTDVVGVRNRPDSPAILPGDATWNTHQPTQADGNTPNPVVHQPDTNQTRETIDAPDWDQMDSPNQDPLSRIEAALQRELAAMNETFDRNETAAREQHQRAMDRIQQARQELGTPLAPIETPDSADPAARIEAALQRELAAMHETFDRNEADAREQHQRVLNQLDQAIQSLQRPPVVAEHALPQPGSTDPRSRIEDALQRELAAMNDAFDRNETAAREQHQRLMDQLQQARQDLGTPLAAAEAAVSPNDPTVPEPRVETALQRELAEMNAAFDRNEAAAREEHQRLMDQLDQTRREMADRFDGLDRPDTNGLPATSPESEAAVPPPDSQLARVQNEVDVLQPDTDGAQPDSEAVPGRPQRQDPASPWQDPLAAIREFLNTPNYVDPQNPPVVTDADRAHAQRLDALLGLDGLLGNHPDPIGALQELAEVAAVRDIFAGPDSVDPTRTLQPKDFTDPVDIEKLYGPEQYWRNEADPTRRAEIEAELAAIRRAEIEAEPAARGQLPAPNPTPNPTPEIAPGKPAEVAPASTTNNDVVPRVASAAQVRNELANQFGRTDTDLNHRNLPATIADLRMRNLLRAGAVEVLAAAVGRHLASTDPAARAQIAATRDTWARRLGVSPAALNADPARVLAEQRAAVLRAANDVADLADVVQVLRQPRGAEPGVLRYANVDGERVPVRLVPDADNGWRVVSRDRLAAPAIPDRPALPPGEEPKPGLVKRVLNRFRSGYAGQKPSYPMGHGIGGHKEALDGISAVTGADLGGIPSAGQINQGVTMVRRPELLPFLNRFTNRTRDASADVPRARTRDGREYRPEIDEADPELFQREWGFSLEDYKAHLAAQEAAEQRALTQAEPEPAPPVGEQLPHTTQEVEAWLQDLDRAQAERDALKQRLVEMAIDLEVDLPADLTSEALAGALADLEYMQARRLGSLLGIAGAAGRFNIDNAWVPYRDEINILDNDPLGRFLKEVILANGGELGSLDWEPVNNGGEPGPAWSNIDLQPAPGRDHGLLPYLDNALRRAQLLDELGGWAQQLGVDLDALDAPTLRGTLGEQFAGLLQHIETMNDFRSVAEQFTDVESGIKELSNKLAAAAGAGWVIAQGGTMLTPEIGLVPGEPGRPMRMIVLDADSGHDAVVARLLTERPELVPPVNDDKIQVDRRTVAVDREGSIRIAPAGTPQVRHLSVDIDGRHAEITVVRDEGQQWRAVPDPLAAIDPAAEQAEQNRQRNQALDSLTPKQLAEARNGLISDLGLDQNSPVTREQVANLRYENLMRAAQIEAIIDYARTTADIETYDAVQNTRARVAHFLQVNPAQLTPDRLAAAMADPKIGDALQKAEALVNYAAAVRAIDAKVDPAVAKAVDAARDRLARRLSADPAKPVDLLPKKYAGDEARLARRLGIKPEELALIKYADEIRYLPDFEGIDPKKLRAAIANMAHRPDERAELIAALTEFAETLAKLDKFDPVRHGDKAVDPRVAGVQLPVHKQAVAFLRELIGDIREFTDQFLQRGIPDIPAPDGTRPTPSSDWARIMGVDLTSFGLNVEPDPAIEAETDPVRKKELEEKREAALAAELERRNNARWAKVYEAFRDGALDADERLSPEKLAQLQQHLREEISGRDAQLRALEEVLLRLEARGLDENQNPPAALAYRPQQVPTMPWADSRTPEIVEAATDPPAGNERTNNLVSQQDPGHPDPETPDAPATPDLPAQHAPDRLAVGTDPATQRVFQNLRNEGAFDVILHGDAHGNPTDGNGNPLTPQQLADAIRNSPGYVDGTPVRLVSCNSANGFAQQLADALNAPVTAPSDVVGIRNRPDSPAVLPDNATWNTHEPTQPDGDTPEPSVHQPETNQPRATLDGSDWDTMNTRPDAEPGAEPLFRHGPRDRTAGAVDAILGRTETGSEAQALLRQAGATVRYGNYDDALVGRTMDVRIDISDRSPAALAAAVVDAAVRAEAIRAGELPATPAEGRFLSPADQAAAQLRTDAAALGRQAELARELSAAGQVDTGLGWRPLVDQLYTRALHEQYLTAYDAAVAAGLRVDAAATPEQLRALGRDAGIDALLAGDLFDAQQTSSADPARAGEVDALQPGEYQPATPESARALARLVQEHAGLRRQLDAVLADVDRVARSVSSSFDPIRAVDVRALLDHGPAAVVEGLLERFSVYEASAETVTRMRSLAELTAQHQQLTDRIATAADRIADHVGRELVQSRIRAEGGRPLDSRVALLPGAPDQVLVAEVGGDFADLSHAVIGSDVSLLDRLGGDPVATRVTVHVDDSGVVRVRQEQSNLWQAWNSERTRTGLGVPVGETVGMLTEAQVLAQQPPLAHDAAAALNQIWARFEADSERDGIGPRDWAQDAVAVADWTRDTLAAREVRVSFSGGRDIGYDIDSNSLVLDLHAEVISQVGALTYAATMADALGMPDGPLDRLTMFRDEYVATMLDRTAEALARSYEMQRLRLLLVGVYDAPADATPLAQLYFDAVAEAQRTARQDIRTPLTDAMVNAAAHRAAVRAVRARLIELGPSVNGRDPAAHFRAHWDLGRGVQPINEPTAPANPRDEALLIDRRAASYANEIQQLPALREEGRFVPVGPAERTYTEAYDRALAKAEKAAARAADPAAVDPEKQARAAGEEALRKYLKKAGLETAETSFDVVRLAHDNLHGYQPWPMDGTTDPETEPAPAQAVRGDTRTAEDIGRKWIDDELRSDPGGVRLTPNVAEFPGYPPRLVIAAAPGGHLDALHALTAAHPDYADVLWNGQRRLEYVQANPSVGGDLWYYNHVDAAEAEGPARQPKWAEAVGAMLDHYVRLRAGGHTQLGFTAWLGQLGAGSTPLELDAHGRAAPRLDFVQRGFLMARADPSLGDTHPAHVAHQLFTRQIALPPIGSAGTQQRAYPQFVQAAVPLDGLPLTVWLQSDGVTWRVAPPTGADLGSDAVAQFSGLNDTDYQRLADRIGDILQGEPAGEPKTGLRRFIPFGGRSDGDSDLNRPAFPVTSFDPAADFRAADEHRQAVLDQLAADAVRDSEQPVPEPDPGPQPDLDAPVAAGPPVQYTPDAVAIGGDPGTARVAQNLRNEGALDVIVHSDRDGNPSDGNGNRLTLDQIADLVRQHPGFVEGREIRLVSCDGVAIAQQLANALNSPVTAPTDIVGVRNQPDSPAVVRDNGDWHTFEPTRPDGTTPEPTVHQADPNQPWESLEEPGWDTMNDPATPHVQKVAVDDPALAPLQQLHILARKAAVIGWKRMGGAVAFEIGKLSGEFVGFSGAEDAGRSIPQAKRAQVPEIAPPAANNSVIPNLPPSLIRSNDAENNMLEHLFKKLQQLYPLGADRTNPVSGRMTLFSEQTPCDSCTPTIEQFQRMYPNVHIDVLFVTDYPPVQKNRPTLTHDPAAQN
ncbi:deaminase domain-containing protein [Nocardia sp. NPDC050712]|uniref:WXG100-like domain-containing protein n=1 Tax=Nocardia sp. NPDC050712 TaxID=3155518 RepID=UPI003410CD48